MLLPAFIAAALIAAASATKLYVSSYTGFITTLNLTNTNGTYHLAQLDSNNGCQPNASVLHLDRQHQNLYCVDEGITFSNGTLNSFKVNEESGALTLVNRTTTVDAPVNSVIYTSPNDTQLLAVAHYVSGLTTWSLDPISGSFAPRQSFNFTLDKPGPNAARQAGSHPHQVLVDPENRYLVIPDLGGDLVRIFYIDPQTLLVSPRPSFPVVLGSGPRHGQFYVPNKHSNSTYKETNLNSTSSETNATFYYLVTELITLTGYQVIYIPQNGGLKLTPINNSTTYGPSNHTAFAGNAAAEISIAHDGKTLIVSNRNATFFDITNPDPKNATFVASDTLATFSISPSGDGTVNFGQLSPAGGSFPRDFSENMDESLIAVALQDSGRVVIYGRCRETGTVGNQVLADFEGLGQVTSVV